MSPMHVHNLSRSDFQMDTLDTQGSDVAKTLAENENLKKKNTPINRKLNNLHEE